MSSFCSSFRWASNRYVFAGATRRDCLRPACAVCRMVVPSLSHQVYGKYPYSSNRVFIASIVGEPVTVVPFDFEGNARRGLVANCRREDGSLYTVSTDRKSRVDG